MALGFQRSNVPQRRVSTMERAVKNETNEVVQKVAWADGEVTQILPKYQ